MSRISRDNYEAIMQALEKGTRVADIAAQWGCTAANIYMIKRKCEAEAKEAVKPSSLVIAESPKHEVEIERFVDTSNVQAVVNTRSASPVEGALVEGVQELQVSTNLLVEQSAAQSNTPEYMASEGDVPEVVHTGSEMEATELVASVIIEIPGEEPVSAPVMASVAAQEPHNNGAENRLNKRVRSGASAAVRNVYVLRVRSSDEEQDIMPSRTLEDLLAGIRPVLRQAAKRADDVWFSIQTIPADEVGAD